ncbi:MAG: PQQ-dependent sugar dehydrogenase [Planctomycetales bacterium]|nr:PQQ-dependent sugar dehydrogenase [Planctomycetales bacterium]
MAGDIDRPTAISAANDGRLFVTEKLGALRVIKDGALLPTSAFDLEVVSEGEHGLVGMVLDPNFTENGHVYVYYTTAEDGVHNRLSRFTLDGDQAVAGSELILMDFPSEDEVGLHNGGGMTFGLDGMLYVGVGDNGFSANARSLETTRGSILRLNPDGTIPTDNPFYNSTTGINRAIYAIGVRNPFTMETDPLTGRIFFNDVGGATFEEVNELEEGGDFGWPLYEGVGNDPGFVDPLHAYGHGFSGAHVGCAVTGGTFYQPANPQFPATYADKYFFLDLCGGWIDTYDLTTGEVEQFASGLADVPIHMEVDPFGALYYLSRPTGAVMKIEYPVDSPPAVALQPQDLQVAVGEDATFHVSAGGSEPISYQWQRNGIDIPGAESADLVVPATMLADDGDQFRVVITNPFGSTTSDAASLTVIDGQRPAAVISMPLESDTYIAGDTIQFTGAATDNEDGALPLSSLTWEVNFHHDEHFHPMMSPFSNAAGGSFVVPIAGETSANTWYRIHLTAVDSTGLETHFYRDIHPETSFFTLEANYPEIGLSLDGAPVIGPHVVEGVVGAMRSIGVATPQTIGDREYQFIGWSDGGSRNHVMATPAIDTTFTATFAARVIDNGEPGYAEQGAGWADGIHAGWKSTSSRASNNTSATASWTPVVKAGLHRVRFYRVVDPANTTSAQLRLTHAGETTLIPIDLTAGGSGWVDLGVFEFNGLGGESLVLENLGGSGQLIADAAEFHDLLIRDDSLVTHFTLDEGAGAAGADTAPHGVPDTAVLTNGAAWSTQGIGGAVALDGVDDRLSISDTEDINDRHNEQTTVSFWFRADDVDATGKHVLYKQGGPARGLSIYLESGNLYAGGWSDEAGWAGTFHSTATVESGQWHHVALVLDAGPTATPNGLMAYLDGELFGAGDGARVKRHLGNVTFGSLDGSIRFHTGNSTTADGDAAFAGLIDEIRIYQRAVSADEALALAGARPHTFVLQVAVDALSTFDASPALSGTVNDPSALVQVEVAGQTHMAVNLGNGAWQLANDTLAPLVPGIYDVVATATLDTETAVDASANELTILQLLASDDDLVAYWNLNEGAGAVAADTSPYGVDNSASLAGNPGQTEPDWVGEGLNGSLHFDGVADLLEVADSADINASVQLQRTISLWFRAEDLSPGRRQVLYEQGGRKRGLNIYLDGDTIFVGGWATDKGWAGTYLNRTRIDADRWYHVALVLDGQNTLEPESLLAYLDGGEFGRGEGQKIFPQGGGIGIGRTNEKTLFHDGLSPHNENGFLGAIDEIQVYNRALNGSEIAALASAPFANGAPSISVDPLVTSDNSPALTGTVSDPSATISVTVNAATYMAINQGDGHWLLAGGTIAPPLAVGIYEVQAVATNAQNVSGSDTTANELEIVESLLSDEDLVGYWALNKGSGDVALDTSPVGLDNSASLVGGPQQTSPAWNADGDGGSLTFDGQNDLLDLPDSVDINGATKAHTTVSLWFKADDITVADRMQVLYEQGGTQRGLNIYLHDSHLYVGGWSLGDGWAAAHLVSDQIQSGMWHHVVLVLDGGTELSPDALSAYLDGQAFGTSPGPGVELAQQGGRAGVGRVDGRTRFHMGPSNLNEDGFAGMIDEVRIYNRALDGAEVAARFDHDAAHFGVTGGHSHGDLGETIEIADHELLPEVTLLVDGNALDGYRVQVAATNFVFSLDHINGAHVAGEGHVHLYLDGAKIATIFDQWFDLPALSPGSHEISLTLQANTHATYTHHGIAIGASQTLNVPLPPPSADDAWIDSVDAFFGA